MERDGILRTVGGSLVMTVPREMVRAFDLRTGDTIRWYFWEGELKVEIRKMNRAVPEVKETEAA